MSTQIQKIDLNEQQINTLNQAGVIPKGTPLPIIQVFAETCKQHNLSPFKKEIYLVKYGNGDKEKYHTIIGIDGARTKAARTGQYAGKTDVKFNIKSNGEYMTAFEVKESGKPPVSATVTVKRILSGIVCEYTHTAVFAEFYPSYGKSNDYSKAAVMPIQMISKVAESFALKQAFSDELAGLHIEEEGEAFEAQPQKPTIEISKKPELTPSHEQWGNVVAALSMNQCDMNYIRARFSLTDTTILNLENAVKKYGNQSI